MRHRLAAPLLALLALAPRAAADGTAPPLPPEPEHTAAITAEEFLWQDAWLSCDARKGRESGGRECHEAALWIASRMAAMGLAAPERAPGHLQPWILPGGVPVPGQCGLEVRRADAEPLVFAADGQFVVLGGSGAGDVEAPVVFAGYGIQDEGRKYDDFAGVDCRGKIVLVLRHEPREKDPESRWNGDRLTVHAFFPYKVRAAKQAGAAAVILLNDLGNHDLDSLDARSLGIPGDAGIPVVLATREVAAAILGGAGATQQGLQKAIDDADAPASREIPGVRVRLRTTLHRLGTENVVGALPGADPERAGEWVVVGAHYDHVGLGYAGGLDPKRYGEIHNGADDNASGVAALLEVAESFALGGRRPRRSLLFVAFSGEEEGLFGSQRFVRDPVVPLDRVVAMVNLDMVGRYRPGLFDVVGADSGSTLRESARRAAEGLDLEPRFTNAGMANSDGFSFYGAKVPSVFLFTGLHEDYHRPGDDWEKLDAAGAARVATMAARLARDLADADGRPAFQPLDPATFGMGRRDRVVLGVRLGAREDGEGALVESVSEGSPAAAGGIRPGDRILSLGESRVADRGELLAALARLRAGDRAQVRLRRGDGQVAVEVEFPRPPAGPVLGVVVGAPDDGKPGLVVLETVPGGVAAKAGLLPGDRLLSLGGRAVADEDALADLLQAIRPGETVALRVLRGGKETALEARFP